MIKKLEVKITLTHDTETGDGDANISIDGQHNDHMLNALIVQIEILKQVTMERINKNVNHDKGELDGRVSFN